MAYLPGTGKVIISGTLAGGEVFAHGFQIQLPTTMTQTDITGICNAIRDAFVASFLTAGTKSLFPTTTVWTNVTLYYYLSGPTVALTATAAIASGAGTGAGATLPNQVACVATLLTGIPGRSNRGRSYLPAPHASGLSAGQLSTATAGAIATPFAAFLSALIHNSTWAILVVVSSGTKGTIHTINSVRVDTKLDTQRRRANKQVVVGASTANVA